MHELSIVSNIVDAVSESLARYPGARVTEVRLRVGRLAAVVEDALQFCYGIATEATPLAGSTLVVRTVPVVAYCQICRSEGALESLQSFRCARCGEPAGELRQGRELEIESIEIEETGIEETGEAGVQDDTDRRAAAGSPAQE